MSVKASSSLSLNVETGEADDDAAGAGAVNAGATGWGGATSLLAVVDLIGAPGPSSPKRVQ